MPAVIVAGKQIFATHYMNGALSFTAVLRGPAGASNHLVHLNRLEIDVLDGLFGPLKRAIIQRRIRRETAAVFRALRRRLESWPGCLACKRSKLRALRHDKNTRAGALR